MQAKKIKRQRGFGHGGLRLIVLHLLQQQAQHGYQLMKTIDELTQGSYRPSPGVLYPLLTELQERNWIDSAPSADGRKQCYQLTARGQQAYQDQELHIQEVLQWVHHRAQYPKHLSQALEGFRYDLHDVLQEKTLNMQQADQVIAILNNALQQIKNLED
ncbi:PadR family transcriptional regulator [Acinetobacter larvae]|uniref:Transcription regulator PadR N-terminal domain-containing protein n=1 Tax=Acinetobacter larvae TaxID=1789224 RepID=A0A1B2LYP3_9GAMM|nr:PadR family transcriptional regulator [Acinetobacter larvae]AOA58046.1 hypothetical protein BFG52_06565 [Acinetobacter larvae]